MTSPLADCRFRRVEGNAQAILATAACLLLILVGAAGCTREPVKQILAERDGVEVSLREERDPPRPPPGPEFDDVTPGHVERSLNRLVIRHTEVIVFDWSDPKPLLTPAQRAILRDEIVVRLPGLSPGQRIGFMFLDQYKRQLVDVEVFPAGPHLVYDFRSLLLRDKKELGRGNDKFNEGELFLQSGQELAGTGQHPLLRDPIRSAARPNFDLDEEGQKQEDIF